MSGAETAYVRSGAPLARQLEDETVMFHPQLGKYFALDPVGSRVWALLEQPLTVPQLCAQLTSEFDVDMATCVADVSALIEELKASQLVESCA